MGFVRFKIVLVGDENVGKSSLVRRFVDNKFTENYIPTLGFQLFLKPLTFRPYTVELTIWDIAGQPSFEFVRRNYYSHSQGFMLVLDLTKSMADQHLEQWIAEVHAVCPEVPFILVGNKADLPEQKVEKGEFDKKSKQLGAAGEVITSAKTGTNVVNAFDLLGRVYLSALELKGVI
ncbi:MAG: small GTP-binding protein [Promethearchaeota archaeon CR_4]|nr:MAG: small GTP-binding protein [Candidatus Lokiarchaeota archaeon CR_4]